MRAPDDSEIGFLLLRLREYGMWGILQRSYQNLFHSIQSSLQHKTMESPSSNHGCTPDSELRFAPDTWSSARKPVEDEISYYLRRIQDLKTRLNTFTWINSIPTELLRMIFLHLAGMCDPDRLKPALWKKHHPYDWICVTHVCRQWREVALCFPTLWSHIVITRQRDLMKTLLERSTELPLSVAISKILHHVRHSEFNYPSSRETDKLVLSQLHRTRTLWIAADRYYKGGLFRWLDAPAPLLESLLITNVDRVASSRPQQYVEGLLRRLNGGSLRRLHLRAFTISWDVVTALSSLTHLTLRDVNILPDVVLSLLPRLPLLHELILVPSSESWVVGSTGDASVKPVVAVLDTPVSLHHLRRLRVEYPPPFCDRLLRHLEVPDLRCLYIDSSSTSLGPLCAGQFFAALAPKIKTLGWLQTAMLNTPRNTSFLMVATRDNMSSTFAPESPYLTGALNSRADFTLHLDLDDVDVFTHLCQALPLSDIRSLLLTDEMSGSWRSILGEYATKVTHLYYRGVAVLPWLQPQIETNPGAENSLCRHVFPQLHLLTLHEPGPQANPLPGDVPKPRSCEDEIIECFISRYETGAEIERLRLVRPWGWQDTQFSRMGEVVRFVDIHLEDESEMGQGIDAWESETQVDYWCC